MPSHPTPTPTSMRRVPVQQRSAERLARILDACAELLDEAGYEALTTRAVAERAGVPIGSVYRFFGNKRQLADALAHRNLTEFTERIERGLEDREGSWQAVIDVMLDEYVAMKRTVPGFVVVDFAGNDLVAEHLTELLAEHTGRNPELLRRAGRVAIEAADALLQLAFRDAPQGDPALIAETRTLLTAYLAQTLTHDPLADARHVG
ncbi:TetR/AcrR family transcriptional regulator [Streptomyces sp. A7024]|uniref:TetR/AcrR family transcriptional regulator n=1 Tax=Streptomyces coryli TaxID=1128680 RepID=A0A6G4UB04_9ACTN|nr:TetR/AcrR family transcriptional regulator [Streptomyces coryli]NGN69409.1 TetR/AcrR family transcriptional regulator [Streptomyces coryli]